MKTKNIISAFTFLLLAVGVQAGEEQAPMEKPSIFASHRMVMTATVQSINHETREVTLRDAEGNEVTFTASDEARNLNQVMTGDIVTAEYIETMSIEVMANDSVEPGAGGMTAVARTEVGEMPGMAAVDTTVVMATVEEINLEANTFKLKGPDGTVEEFVARNPDNLRRAEVGDLVVMKFTEAVAISVDFPPAE